MRVVAALVACLSPLFAVAAQVLPAPAQPATTVTVYRCTSATGKVSLQDAPCAAGQAQQARQMQRPVDAPARPVPSSPVPPPATVAVPPARDVVYLAPPRPLYECVTPDGERYTSDDGRGNPRWVPLWTLGIPVARRPMPGGGIGSPAPPSHPAPSPRDRLRPLVGGGGTWVRDDCAILPPAEACARLRDRRAVLRTRFFNAQEKERDALRTEERALNARLDNDCGGR